MMCNVRSDLLVALLTAGSFPRGPAGWHFFSILLLEYHRKNAILKAKYIGLAYLAWLRVGGYPAVAQLPAAPQTGIWAAGPPLLRGEGRGVLEAGEDRR